MMVSRAGETSHTVQWGFQRSNCAQLVLHFILAILVGISLRLTTFPEATFISSYLGDEYKAKTSFLVSFGFTKAISNLIVGRISDIHGRKIPHVIGWGFGVVLGIILLLLWQTTKELDNLLQDAYTGNDEINVPTTIEVHMRRKLWVWYVLANTCLGAQQGWTWTTNIFMHMDILGPHHHALASGIANSLGYSSSAFTAYAAAFLSTEAAFTLVLTSSAVGFVLSFCFVNDTTCYVAQENMQDTATELQSLDVNASRFETPDEKQPIDDGFLGNNSADEVEDSVAGTEVAVHMAPSRNGPWEKRGYDLVTNSSLSDTPPYKQQIHLVSSPRTVFVATSWRNKSTAVMCCGGLMANLVTSLAWGLVLIWGKEQQLSSLALANIGSAFTFTKGIMMVMSGYVSDRLQNRKRVLVCGFFVVIVGLVVTATADQSTTVETKNIYKRLLIGGIIIGFGIGSVYCVMTASLSDHTPPQDRASAIGVYKLWRDSGYAFGGLLTGWIADASGGSFVTTVIVVALLVGLLVMGIVLYYREVDNSRRKLIQDP